MLIYKRKYGSNKDFFRSMWKWRETTLKCLSIATLAALPTIGVVLFWKIAFHNNHFHVGKETREVIITTVVPVLGLLYSLLVTVLMTRVFDEYKDMRIAVKSRDIEKFMQLRDEDLSPLLHALVTLIAMIIISGLMIIEYPHVWEGSLVMGGTAYIFALLCVIIYEIDDPCSGFWYIKNIPEQWLKVEPKAWRNNFYKNKEETILLTLTANTEEVHVTIATSAAPNEKVA